MNQTKPRSRLVVFTHAGGSPHHGPNMRWYYLGRALRAFGWSVEIVSASWFHKYNAPPQLERTGPKQEIDGLIYHWMPSRRYDGHGFGQILNQWDYTRKAWHLAGSAALAGTDVVIASSPHPFAFFPAWRLARRSRATLLFETRDLWPLAIRDLGSFNPLHPYIVLLGLVERFAVRRADALVSVKPGDWRYFNDRYGIEPTRQHYMPNGFLAPAAQQGAESRQSSSEYRIGYVGALSNYYGLDCLLDAARLLRDKDFRFVIVGGGSDSGRLKAAAADLSKVEFVGPVPKHQVPAMLSSIDLCYLGLTDIAANRFGISCNKLFDYMAAAKPVLASYHTDYDPVEAANCGITVVPGDARAIADAILWMHAHSADALEMGRRGRSYFDAEHDFRHIAERYDRLLRSDFRPTIRKR